MQRMTWVGAGSLYVVPEGCVEEVAPGERALGSVAGGSREVLGEAASRWPSQGGLTLENTNTGRSGRGPKVGP